MKLDAAALTRIERHGAVVSSELLNGHTLVQPKVELCGGTVVGHEVLFRPEGWEWGAEEFYRRLRGRPIRERLGVEATILAITNLAITPGAAVSFNVSLPLLGSRLGRQLLRSVLDGRPPGTVTIELLETDIPDTTEASAVIAEMAGAGARIALDDFGKGYSSLALAGSLPALDELKLDASIVHNRRSEALVTSLVSLAGKLGASTTAEHVDSAACAERMREYGVECAQGFLYGRPASAATLGLQSRG